LKQALRQLLGDFLSAILFLVVYVVSGSLFAAAGIAVAAGLAQLVRLKVARRRIEPMQSMSLGLVVALGGATMLTQSPRFMMIKPTIVHFAVATVMLRRGWMLRYLPEIVLRSVPEPTIVAAGYAGQACSRCSGSPTCSLLCASTSPFGRGLSRSARVGQNSPRSPYNTAFSARSCARGSRGRRCRFRPSRYEAFSAWPSRSFGCACRGDKTQGIAVSSEEVGRQSG